MLVYGVISSETEKAVGLFARREGAEAMVTAVREDDPSSLLRVELIELDAALQRRRGRVTNRSKVWVVCERVDAPSCLLVRHLLPRA